MYYIYINKTQVCVYVLHSDKKQKTQLFDKFSNSLFIFWYLIIIAYTVYIDINNMYLYLKLDLTLAAPP